MERQQNRDSASLDELRRRLTETDLIPSQEPLLEEIAARFASLEEAGVSSVAELRRQMKSPGSLAALAEASEVDAGYLALLKRALGGFFPKPRALKDFTRLDENVVSKLNDAGIKNTNQFNQAVASGIARLEQELCLRDGALTEVAALSDLSRAQWVSPNFAGALVAAGYRSAAALAAADPQALYEAVAKANGRSDFYKGTVGQRDIHRVIQAARYVHWTAQD